MLENARQQAILVLLTIVAGLLCIAFLDPVFGPDLKGGTQLRYEVRKELIDDLLRKNPGTTVQQVMDQTVEVIRDRVDPTGTLDALVTVTGDTGILIELPWIKDQEERRRVQERIANLGKLEMRIVATDDYVADFKFNLAEEKKRLEAWLNQQGGKELLADDLRNIRRFNDDAENGPIAFGKLHWYPHLITPKVQKPEEWEPGRLSEGQYTGPSTVKAFDDAEWNNGVLTAAMLAKEPRQRHLIELVAVNMHEVHFTGEDLDPSGVHATTSRDGGLAVGYTIKDARSGAYADWSEKYINKASAIILNGIVKSAPYFMGRIPGNGIIQGRFTKAEVDELVKVLRTGSLRVEPELESRSDIGPTLGDYSIKLGRISLIAGGLLVFLFMLWFYRIAGVVACVTLVLNVTLLWAAVLLLRATITLPGLGGLVLTMGMAVDANVLIYERIREELAKGKDLVRAVRAGFERAMSAILDSNITTFLTGLVLFSVGVGPVRGFAVTLMVGIVTTVFTQFFVTRLCFHWLIETKRLVEYRARSLFTSLNIDFVRYIKPAGAASLAVIVAGILYAIFVVPREVLLGLDFTGGANLRMVVSQPMTAEEVKAILGKDAEFNANYHNVAVNTVQQYDQEQRGDKAREFNIRLKLNDAQREAIQRDRNEYRERRAAAQQAGEQPPGLYEPPYVKQLKRVFGDLLVKPAFSDPAVMDHPNENLKFAQITLHFQEPVDLAQAKAALQAEKLLNVDIRARGPDGSLLPDATQARDAFVEWTTQSTTRSWELFDVVAKALQQLKDVSGQPISLSDPFPEAQEIQGRVVGELRTAAIGALLLSWVLIVLYLRVRFHEYRYGFAAVVALIHDVFVTFGIVVVANHLKLVSAELNLNMIACFLTIVGYSVNDTIVIFDRIRENLHENQRLGVEQSMRDLINRSLNQTMSRTLLTSGVTLFCVLAQFLVNWGSGSDLESFAFAMLVGMVSGTYSTIYIAAPILIYFGKPELPPLPATVEASVPEQQS